MRRIARASASESSWAAIGQFVNRPLAALTGGAALLVFSLALLLGVARASAAIDPVDTYTQIGSFGSGPASGNENFNHPQRAAVDDATGNVLVADTGNNRIQVLKPSGSSVAFLTKFGGGTLSEPFGIAVDQSNSDVYVTDAGNDRIVKFNSNGAVTPTYSVDPTFTSPTLGSSLGQIGDFRTSIAVDPTDGSLWAADPGNNLIQHFSSSGAFQGSFDGSTSPGGPFTLPTDLAVDSAGLITVADGGSESHVDQFEPDGVHVVSLGSFPLSLLGGATVTFDPINGYTLVGSGWYGVEAEKPQIRAFAGATLVANAALQPGELHGIVGVAGLAVDGSSGRLYAVTAQYDNCCGIETVQVLEPGVLPRLTIAPPSAVTSTDAHFAGTVKPNGTPTTYHFEYSSDGGSWTSIPLPGQSVGTGVEPVPVSADAHGLEPNQDYRVRLSATNTAGTKVSSEELFHTDPADPSIEYLGPAPLTATTVRLNARVNPHGIPATYYFEYGTDASYGNSVPATQDADAGQDHRFGLVSQDIEGLLPNTTYHYRIVAQSTVGTNEGDDRLFTTRAVDSGPPHRGIELVNNPDKANQPLDGYLFRGGKQVIWSATTGVTGSSQGSGATFLASRTPSGWHSTNLTPPIDQLLNNGLRPYNFSDFSPDGQTKLFNVFGLFGVGGNTIVTVDEQGQQTVIADLTDTPSYGGANTPDLSHFYFGRSDAYVPEDANGQIDIYEINDAAGGSPELIDRLPDGSIPPCGLANYGGSYGFTVAGDGWVSTDPAADRRIFFEVSDTGPPCEVNPFADLYVRNQDTSTTTLISGPPVSGPARGGLFLRASEDGLTAIFASETRLDPADNNEHFDIYSWINGAGNTCLTCVVPDASVTTQFEGGGTDSFVNRKVAVSKDLSYVYFSSPNQLVPGEGPSGGEKLYVWHDGQIRYIAPSMVSPPGELSADGGTFLFTTSGAATADDTLGIKQLYRYDYAADSLECVSCIPKGAPRTKTVYGEQPFYFDGGSRGSDQREMSADGEDIVFTTRGALVPEDVNRSRDIYEWRGGTVRLVTDGLREEAPGTSEVDNTALLLRGISVDGSDILFSIAAHLTGHELDHQPNLYVAHVGGGFPPPPTPPAPCNEDACQGPLVAPPRLASPGSAELSGSGNSAAKQNKKRHKTRHHKKKKKRQKRHSAKRGSRNG